MHKPLVYLHIIVAETEQAIRILDVKLQNTYRFMATKKLKQIINTTSRTNVLQKRQLHVMKELNNEDFNVLAPEFDI
jgi:hypothetical protein